MTTRQAILFALVMGLVAGGVVWYLERFQADLLAARFQRYLRQHDDFQRFIDAAADAEKETPE